MRTARLKAALALAVTTALGLGAAGCGGDPVADADVTVYSGRAEGLVGPVLEQFEAETGITVGVRYGNTAEMAAQILEEGERTPADVFLAQDAGALGAVAKAGLFSILPPELLERVAATYRAADGSWVGVTGRSRVLVYNPDMVAEDELPTSVFELTEPQWRGRVGVAPTNGSFQAFVTALRVQHGDDATREFLAGLVANEAQIRENNVQIVTDVNEGRLAAGLVNHYYLHQQAKAAGVPVDQLAARNYYFPDGDTGALVNVAGVGILADSAGNADARALVEYLLSSEAQTHFSQETSEYPLVADVPAPEGAPAVDTLEAPDIDLNDLDSLQETVAMITEAGLA